MVRPSYFAKIQRYWRVEAKGVDPDFLHKHTSKARELFATANPSVGGSVKSYPQLRLI
jgi:hypothetical protein